MNTKKITSGEIADKRISSLPTRPMLPGVFGGRGYSAEEMKSAFDRLSLFIIERFNSLIADVEAIGEESLAGSMPTGISHGHTLYQLFSDIASGALAGYLNVGGSTLAARLAAIDTEIAELKSRREDSCEQA